MDNKDNTIVLASSNQGKLRELNALFAELGYTVKPQSEFDVPDVPETGTTFVENAIIKARHACEKTGLPAIADDSGIEIDALNGAPGVYSARYAGAGCSDNDNNQKMLKALSDVADEDKTARYHCVLVFMKHKDDPCPIISQGSWEGFIRDEAKGENGFGYDPYFYVPTHDCHSAELAPEVKNNISHRAIALRQLVEKLK